jgi:hypothetical protein
MPAWQKHRASGAQPQRQHNRGRGGSGASSGWSGVQQQKPDYHYNMMQQSAQLQYGNPVFSVCLLRETFQIPISCSHQRLLCSIRRRNFSRTTNNNSRRLTHRPTVVMVVITVTAADVGRSRAAAVAANGGLDAIDDV